VTTLRALRPTGGFLRGFSHTLNPYIGCRFACPYCYVAALPVALRGGGRPWGDWVVAKHELARGLERDLAELAARNALPDTAVFCGSATDPYQPLERKLGSTRACLEELARRPVGCLVLQTRSPAITRDLELLAAIPGLLVSLTIETDLEQVRRRFTPRCPPLADRWRAARLLRRRGIEVQIAVSPLLPCDRERFVDLLADHADRIVVDTLISGDGAGGRRSAQLPIADLFARAGLDYRDESPALELLARLRDRLGADRVGFSCEGFNRAAEARAGVG
jgi:DNA repair photolyase